MFLYCRVGFRSYLAYRMLVQLDFEQISTLAGGSKTFMSYHRTELSDGRPGVSFVSYAELAVVGGNGLPTLASRLGEVG